MRQAAVIALLAYCGSFVPARAADDRPARRDPHAHRRRRRSRRRALDVHGRDDRGGGDPASRDAAEPRADRRDRPRHLDLRRPGARLGDRAPARREEPLPRAVRDALLRADRAARRDRRLRQPALRRGRARRRHRVPARAPRTARPTAATGCRWRSSPACPPTRSAARRTISRGSTSSMRPRRRRPTCSRRRRVAGERRRHAAGASGRASAVARAARRARSGRDDAARRAGRALRAAKLLRR